MDDTNGKRTQGRLEQSVEDIREDIQEIKCHIKDINSKLADLEKWCHSHNENNLRDYITIKTGLDKVTSNQGLKTKRFGYIATGIFSVVSAIASSGVTLFIVEILIK